MLSGDLRNLRFRYRHSDFEIERKCEKIFFFFKIIEKSKKNQKSKKFLNIAEKSLKTPDTRVWGVLYYSSFLFHLSKVYIKKVHVSTLGDCWNFGSFFFFLGGGQKSAKMEFFAPFWCNSLGRFSQRYCVCHDATCLGYFMIRDLWT